MELLVEHKQACPFIVAAALNQRGALIEFEAFLVSIVAKYFTVDRGALSALFFPRKISQPMTFFTCLLMKNNSSTCPAGLPLFAVEIPANSVPSSFFVSRVEQSILASVPHDQQQFFLHHQVSRMMTGQINSCCRWIRHHENYEENLFEKAKKKLCGKEIKSFEQLSR